MSRTIDERVVSMQFDNKQFERNVQTSLGTLDKLKQSLNFHGATKGLENIDRSVKSVNMGVLGDAVDKVSLKFSLLYSAADQFVRRTTDRIESAARRWASAFTIDPIKTGFAEYETQIGAVQTILANTQSKGTDLDDVNAALDELNRYADKTIYNFTEMTRNIGTFTAAGVDLDKSVTSIQGIANLAAVSGSTSQQASTAMYQLSQALAAGKVQLMDWNSVVNAGMGGELFQNALKRTAKHMGYNVDEMIKKYGSFRESLTQGEWLTAEVLTETLTQLSGAYTEADLLQQGYTKEQAKEIVELSETAVDAATKVKTFTQLMDTLKEAAQSGWTQTWELLVGDFEEAKKLWTSVSDIFGGMINNSAEARNKLLGDALAFGGREKLLDSFVNIFKALQRVIEPIRQAFRDIFPATTAKQLRGFIDGFHSFTEKLILSKKNCIDLRHTFQGVFAVFDIVWTVIKQLAGGIVRLIGSFSGLEDGVLSITGGIGGWLTNLRDSIKETDIFGKAIDALVGFLQNGITNIKEFGSSLKGKIDISWWEVFTGVLKGVWDFIQKIGSKVAEVGSSIGDALANAFRSGDISAGLDVINGGLLGAVLLGIRSFIKGAGDVLEDAGGIFGSIKGVLDGVKDSLEAWQQQLKAKTLLQIAAAIGILAVSLLLIATINPERLSAALGGVTMLFANLMGSMALFNKISASGFVGAGKAVVAMIGISAAVLILAGALKMISDIGWEDLAKGLLGIAGLTAIVVASAKVLGSDSKKIISGATQMVIFAAAIKVLASVCKDLAALSWEELGKGLVGVGVLMAEVAIFLNTAKFSGKSITTASGIVVLAAAMKILASSCKDFAGMSWTELGKGLASIGGLLLEIALFTKMTGNAKNVVSTGLSLVLIGASMKIFASAVSDFTSMNWEDIGKGLTGLAGALLAVAISTRIMPKNMLGIGVGLAVVSASLLIIADVLSKMGGMSWGEIGKGLATLGGSILILAIGLNAMNGAIAGAAALVVASAALAIITPVLTTLGGLSWGEIAKGLITIAAAFAIIGIAGYALAPAVPAILGIGAAFALLGVGVLAVGAGLAAAAAGLGLFATVIAGSATAIVAALTIIVTGIAGLIPVVVQRIGEAIIVFCEVIAAGAPAIGEAIKAVVLTLVDVLVECVPVIAEGALKLIVGLLDALVQYTPQIVEGLYNFFISAINALAGKMPGLIEAGLNLLTSFFTGLAEALVGFDSSTLISTAIGVGLMAGLMAILSAIAPLTPGALAGVLGLGLVIAELGVVLAAIGALAQIPGLDWLISEGGALMEKIGSAIGGFVGSIIGGVAEGISASLPDIGTNLSNFMTNLGPFIEGAKQIDASSLESVNTLVGIIKALSGASILESIASFVTGSSSMDTFATQIVTFGGALKSFADEVAGIDQNAVTAAANAGQALATMADSIPNEGGLVSWFAGENSLTGFSTNIQSFGAGIKNFATEVAGIDTAAVSAAANAGVKLAEMADKIPNEGGIASWFAGDNTLSEFADNIKDFGTGIKNFSDEVTGIDTAAVATAATAGLKLAEMADKIPNEGGIVSWFAGDNSLSDFSDNIQSFGAGIKKFSDEVTGLDTAAVTAAVAVTTRLNSISSTVTDGETLKTFGENIDTFGDDLADFIADIVGLDTTGLDGAIAAIEELGSIDLSGLSSMGESLAKVGKTSVDKFIKSFTNAKRDFYDAGKNLMAYLIKGVDSQKAGLSKSLTRTMSVMVRNVKDNYEKFYGAGKFLVQGFAMGITANTFRAQASAAAMANAAYQAAKDALNINSPSRVFRDLGKSVPEGFALGIDKLGGMVKGSATDMADTAIQGTKRAIAHMVDVINSDIDTQPTIRPILDLSDVSSGVNSMSDMFSMTPSMEVLGNVGAISAMMESGQNGSNRDVVSAINNLGRKLNKKSGDTYIIDGVTYDDGSNVSNTVKQLIRAVRMERRK